VARIGVRWESFEQGTLPSVCCKTGEPTDTVVRFDFSRAPSWTWILFFFGIVPFIIARIFASTRYEGALPFTGAAADRLVLTRRVTIGAMIAIAPLFFLAFAWQSFGFAVVVLDLVIAAVAAALNWYWSPGFYVFDPAGLELTRVHPRFVEAVRGRGSPKNGSSLAPLT